MPQRPVIIARNVLTDMDKTLVDARHRANVFGEVLIGLIAQAQNVSRDDAAGILARNHDPDRECISACLPRVGIEPSRYWSALVPRLGEQLIFHPDAAEMLRVLHARGFDLYPATTNSGFAFLAKLATGDMAQDMRTPYYRAVLGGAEVCPDGKSGPGFYRALMERLGLDPTETVMIGDNVRIDLAASREAGIGAAIIVQREQADPWIEIEGGYSVNRLTEVCHMLRRSTSGPR